MKNTTVTNRNNVRPLRIAFMTTVGRNVGDEFIREGIRSFFDDCLPAYDCYYVDKHDLTTLQRPLYDEIGALQGLSPFEHEFALFDLLKLSADGGYIRSAGAVWPEYDAVAYRTRDELLGRVNHFLSREDERRAIAASMRVPVIERFTYTATTRRLLAFIADDLHKQSARLEAAA